MRRALIHNLASVFAWQGLNYVIPLFTLPYLARVLGPAQFGLLGFAVGVVAYFGLVTDWGFALSATQMVASRRADRAALTHLFWNTWFAKIALGSTAFAVLLVLVHSVPRLQQHATLITVAYLQVAGSMIAVDWFLQGMEMMGRFATAATVGRLLPIPLLFVLVHGPDDVVAAAALQTSSSVIGGVISLYLAWKSHRVGRITASPRAMLGLLRHGTHLFISAASVSLYSQMNVLVLTLMNGPVQTGLFVGADKLRNAMQGLLAPVMVVMYPRITNLLTTDRAMAVQWVRRLLVILGGLSALLSIATWVLAPLAVRVLLGPKFTEAVDVLRAVSPVLFLTTVSNVLGVQLLLPLGFRREFMLCVALPGLLSIAYMPALAWYFGAVGVGAALSITELVVTLMVCLFLVLRQRDGALPERLGITAVA